MGMIPADPRSHAARPAPLTEATPDEDLDIDYRTMPPKASIPMSVDLSVRGRGKPLPFPLDDVPE